MASCRAWHVSHSNSIRRLHCVFLHSASNGRNKILAFGIVTVENKHEWTLFYDFCKQHFKNIAHITNDQDKGLISIKQTNIRQGELKHVSHCVAHVVRNENRARGSAQKGGFDISAAGGTVQSSFIHIPRQGLHGWDVGSLLWQTKKRQWLHCRLCPSEEAINFNLLFVGYYLYRERNRVPFWSDTPSS